VSDNVLNTENSEFGEEYCVRSPSKFDEAFHREEAEVMRSLTQWREVLRCFC
jgi:hypothetical protein